MDAEERLSRALADRYRIERQIGRGGMATVYLAHDLKLDRPVALKVLRPEIASSLGPDRFSREIRIAAKLSHPNILALFDCGEAEGLLYYTMPHVEGESLRDRLNREKQLPLEDALAIAREVAEALSHAHRQGLVHRDIKPENILFRGGHAVVADFGIARAVSEAGGGTMTETGLAVGTPAYMSPEQAAGERDVDGRADLYSLGCVLYEMLSGDAPYLASTPQAMLAKKLSEPVPRISVVRESVPAGLEAALAKALARVPADRYRTAEEFGAALERAASGAPAQAKGRWGRAKAVVYAGTVVLGLVTVGVMASHWGSGGPELGEDTRPGIAVLPCENLSARTEDAQYTDALHNQILTKLQMVSGIVPTGLTSVMTYRDHPAPPARIAEELNVAYLGECSVQKEENRVQVAFRLVEARSGRQIWAELFDAVMEVGGIIDMQSEIALKVVDGVGARVTAEEQTRMEARPTESLDAYELYMIGRSRFAHRSPDKLREAIAFFEAAIREDSTFALAHAGLSAALALLPMFDVTIATADVMERAGAAADRALELDPSAGEVQASMALFLHYLAWDWAGAEPHYLEALRRSPGDVHVHVWYGSLLQGLGQVDAGADEGELVLAMDPRSSAILWSMGTRLSGAGRVEEARTVWDRAIEIQPVCPWAFQWAAHSYTWEEPVDLPKAAEMMERFVTYFGYSFPGRIVPLVQGRTGDASLRRGATEVLDHIVSETVLERPDLMMQYMMEAPPSVFFDVLEEVVRVRHSWVPWIPIMVRIMNPDLLGDPRWNAFMTAIKHPGLEPS